jgi:hypothetical protein
MISRQRNGFKGRRVRPLTVTTHRRFREKAIAGMGGIVSGFAVRRKMQSRDFSASILLLQLSFDIETMSGISRLLFKISRLSISTLAPSANRRETMGARMIEDDIYIGTFLDLFNVRFAPTPFSINPETVYGGIAEMANLQEEFKIFKPKRPFSESAALLGLGGIYNARAKNRWLDLLRNLPDDGDQKIADALVANFKRKQPLPCYMRAHDLRTKGENKVVIAESDDPLFYLEQEYLTISLPMAPKPKETGKKAKKKK